MADRSKESADTSNCDKSDLDLSLTHELLESFHAFSIVPEHCRTIYLLYLAGLDSSVIAHAVDLRYSEVEQRIAKAKNFLLEWITGQIDLEIDRATSPTGDREQSTFVRRIIECVPEDFFDVYRRFRNQEKTGPAASMGDLLEDEIASALRKTRLIFLECANQAVFRVLEIDDRSPPPLDQMCETLDRVREIRQSLASVEEASDRLKHVAIRDLSRGEVLEVEDLFFGLDAVYQEVFELDAVEIVDSEIADILDISPEIVRFRRKKAHRILVAQMERLIVSMIRKRKKNPNAPRMKRQAYQAAMAMYREISADSRKAFSFYMATGYSTEEIAVKLDLNEEIVRRRIKEAKKCIRQRVLAAGIAAARKGEPVPKARKRILTRLRYVMALRKGQHKKKVREILQSFQPLDRLTDSERREIALVFESLSTEQKDVYALCKALEIDSGEAADFLGCLESEVKSTLRTIHDLLADRLSQLIAGMIRLDSFVPDAPELPESAMDTARIAYEFVGRRNEESFRRYLLSGSSESEIAAELGLNEKSVAERITSGRRMLSLRGQILLISWLREKENGVMRAAKILHEILNRPKKPVPEKPVVREEPYDYNYFLESEKIEAKKSLRLLDYDCREAFILHVGAGLEMQEIADVRQITVEEVTKRVLNARQAIRQRMEWMIEGMLRISWEVPGAPRMADTEFEAAKATFEFVPKNCRKVYYHYRVLDESVEDIANNLHLRIGKVKDKLVEADRAILTRTFFIVAAVTRDREGETPVGETLLGDPKRIRFPAEVWNRESASEPDSEQM